MSASPYDVALSYAQALLPASGQYTCDGVTAATALCAELARRLCYATNSPTAAVTLPKPEDVDVQVGHLQEAMTLLAPAVAQWSDHLCQFDPDDIYNDGLGRDVLTVPATAATAAAYLDHAAQLLMQVAEQLDQARQYTARLRTVDDSEE